MRPRRDGWTAQRQLDFLEALAATACVEEAARHVGMSERTAYRLRLRFDAKNFREAWDAALDIGVHRLERAALGRALHGVRRPVFYQGEQVGEWREYDERLAMFLLRYRRPARFGAALDDSPALADPDDPNDWGEPELRFDACVDFLEDLTDGEEGEDEQGEKGRLEGEDTENPDFPRTVREGP
ncbi:MAG: hypothetical protein ACR2KH_07435 [Sphingomicrobium sp.]